jgi:hypothetical protein
MLNLQFGCKINITLYKKIKNNIGELSNKKKLKKTWLKEDKKKT